ncbi:GNAT family N-acetyltransferase [Mucilaginibacter sp. UC70_90]
MKKATANDKALVIDLLTASFDENQSVNYIIRQDSQRVKHIRALMDYSFEVCSLFGEVWLSDNHKACALVLYPQQKKTTLKTILLDIQLIFRAIGVNGIKNALNREAQIKQLQPKVEMAYVWFIGVNIKDQYQGIGTKLLKEVIAEAALKNQPVYLETSTVKNLPWYERLGFKIYNELAFGYTLFFLKREPVK